MQDSWPLSDSLGCLKPQAVKQASLCNRNLQRRQINEGGLRQNTWWNLTKRLGWPLQRLKSREINSLAYLIVAGKKVQTCKIMVPDVSCSSNVPHAMQRGHNMVYGCPWHITVYMFIPASLGIPYHGHIMANFRENADENSWISTIPWSLRPMASPWPWHLVGLANALSLGEDEMMTLPVIKVGMLGNPRTRWRFQWENPTIDVLAGSTHQNGTLLGI